MNILYLAHRLPYPPNKGDKLRAFRQLEHLTQRHRVWCACFVDDPNDWQYLPALRRVCERVEAIRLRALPAIARGIAGLLRGHTLTESYYRDRRMGTLLAEWSRDHRFDAVVAFSSGMAPYALHVEASRRVLDLCDLDSQKWLDYADASRWPMNRIYHTEGTRLATKERHWIAAFDATLLITHQEAAALSCEWLNGERNDSPKIRGATATIRDATVRERDAATRTRTLPETLHIVGNGVTLPPARVHPPAINRAIVGFVGVMNYRPNVDAVLWFAGHCWPKIRAAVPQAKFRIVGRAPTRAVRRLAHHDGIVVVGEVDNVTTELNRFDVSVAPLRIARGLQNKVLEAMAASLPVVLTSKTAAAVGGDDGSDYLIADDPDTMANRVIELLRDHNKRIALGQSAHRFVADHFQWPAELAKFERIVTGQSPAVSARLDEVVPAAQRTSIASHV